MQFKRIPSPKGRLPLPPSRASLEAAGYDLEANLDETIVIQPGRREKIPTGIAINMKPTGYIGITRVALVFPRSGLGSRGIILSNSVGVIDADYQGEILLFMWNASDGPKTIDPGNRIAQLVITMAQTPSLEEVTDFTEQTQRGAGGFGSTGA